VATPLSIRRFTQGDLPFADAVRAQAGWNQTMADWQRFLAHDPQGCFLAEWNGAPAGTATTTIYGAELAWIGMVLVAPAHRRQGIGRALLRHCIDYLRERQVRCIKLDATPEGQQVYEPLGFKAEWSLSRWQRPGEGALMMGPDRGTRRQPGEKDWSRIEDLDCRAFGTSRQGLLRALVQFGSRVVVVDELDAPAAIGGCGFLRPGARAQYLGPIVARDPGSGLRLVDALLSAEDGFAAGPVYWDIPDANATVVEHAQRRGFSKQRSLTRMVFGDNAVPGKPELQWAIAGPEVG
jgi:ribosomal protein S18 acetylase RimI-like enzyme